MAYPPSEPPPGQPQPGQMYPAYPPSGAPGYPPQPGQAAQQHPGYGQQQMVPPGYPPPAQPYPGYPPPTGQPYPGQPGYGQPPYPFGQPAYPQMQMMPAKESNPGATQAMIYSFVALTLSILTFVGILAFAGIISGALACFYSIRALNTANKLPGKSGQGQAITGLIISILAIVIVISALVLRAVLGAR